MRLKPIDFKDIVTNHLYIVVIERYERHGSGGVDVYDFTGKELIQNLREFVGADGDEVVSDLDVLELANEINGDGFDYYQIYYFPE